ncbi:MAG: hypothetical protein RL514_1227 [Verrucomicrobiota bacterium]|jgi:site-specific DNA-methyltransferase (adenine-specific)
MNQLFYGDNLNVLREHLANESVDLIYLDPPFNSKRDYNLLFKSPKGHQSEAQIEAFKDSWSWGRQAETELNELLKQKNTDVALMMNALVSFLGRNDIMAYLVMMTNRLLEMHRVLKSTGSLYLHCDPTAAHYLRLVLDAVFGKELFRSEVIWKRTGTHSSAKRWGPVHDVILFYSKSEEFTWSQHYIPLEEAHKARHYRHVDEQGRPYTHGELTAPGVRRGRSGEIWRGFDVTAIGRHWMTTVEKLDKLHAQGLIYLPDNGTWPRLIRYLEDSKGRVIGDIWSDIPPINMQAAERLGYPTQKPLALLERIISASSNEGDVMLDPFCGCGTAVHAAQKLKRNWIGIDITHLAISLIEKRLKDAFGKRCDYDVHGTPKDLDAARDLATRDKYQFQWWAVSLVEAQPFQGKKKGADGGIDGLKFFHDVDKAGARKIVVSVKSGGNLKADDIRSIMAVRDREGAEIALFISLEEPTRGMIADAASAGFYDSATGKKFPRVQLLTIAGLLSGTHRAEHPDHQPDLNFKKAKAESQSKQQALL